MSCSLHQTVKPQGGPERVVTKTPPSSSPPLPPPPAKVKREESPQVLCTFTVNKTILSQAEIIKYIFSSFRNLPLWCLLGWSHMTILKVSPIGINDILWVSTKLKLLGQDVL